MNVSRLALVVVILSLSLSPALHSQTGTGRIEGQVARIDGGGIGGVTVVIHELGLAEITDNNGYYTLNRVTPGTYTVVFTQGDNTVTEEGVTISAAGATELKTLVEWPIGYAESIVVYSASRRVERIVEAPAAVTTIGEKQIERQAAHGQLPKLLEFTPGAEVTQSGIYDYNFNTRGFNSSLNRRVATLIDGRDPSVPFLGAQEWASISFPLDDLASVEFVRGPSAALYGANASSGVLNLTSKQPRYSEGGLVRLTGGELSTGHLDFRWAGALGNDWYLKVNAGLRNSGDFTVSRVGAAEYSIPCVAPGQTDCLPQEVAPLAREDDNEIFFGGIRADRYFGRGDVLTFEVGYADLAGPVFQTGIGRVQLVDVKRPWARVNYSSRHFNVLATYNKRDAGTQLALASGSNLVLDTNNVNLEVQTHWEFADGDVRIVGGAAFKDEEIDSLDPATGRQSLMFEPVSAESQALFAQLDWKLVERFKVVVAGRFDDSDLHDSQFSPKASLVYLATPNNTFRLTYNEAFQVANYSEFFLQADGAAPIDFSLIEAGVCAPTGVDCGFGTPTRILALGNRDLQLEEIRTIELGYSGILGGKSFLTVDYYRSENENFITDLLDQLLTSPSQCAALGLPTEQIQTPMGPVPGCRTNPNFQAYQPPAGLPAPAAAALLAAIEIALGPAANTLLPLLSNDAAGSPIFAARSYTNFGNVDSQGVDFGLNHYFGDGWNLSLSYSWFDFDLELAGTGLEDLLLPNSPENKASLSVGYGSRHWSGNVGARWVDKFRWVVGPFQGDVDEYLTVDLNGNYQFNDHWTVGINIANLADEEHHESFGGDLLARRALGHVAFNW